MILEKISCSKNSSIHYYYSSKNKKKCNLLHFFLFFDRPSKFVYFHLNLSRVSEIALKFDSSGDFQFINFPLGSVSFLSVLQIVLLKGTLLSRIDDIMNP